MKRVSSEGAAPSTTNQQKIWKDLDETVRFLRKMEGGLHKLLSGNLKKTWQEWFSGLQSFEVNKSNLLKRRISTLSKQVALDGCVHQCHPAATPLAGKQNAMIHTLPVENRLCFSSSFPICSISGVSSGISTYIWGAATMEHMGSFTLPASFAKLVYSSISFGLWYTMIHISN